MRSPLVGNLKYAHVDIFLIDRTCEDGTVHLVGGDSITRGRVEYCYQGRWYSVCASGWDDREARVICRSLGYVIGELM